MSWERIRLGDCCEITSSKRIFYSEYTDYGIPFYRSKEIIDFSQGQSISEPLYIANQRYHEIKNRFGVPVAGDMLLTSVGTIGIPYIVKETDEFYFKDGNLTWFRNFTSKLCARYLYYWVISKEGNGVLNNTTIGSSQKALTISALKNVEITVPSIGKQRRIADILSAYDDLIENNRKQIKLLEEAAQRLYKEWFVDLRFPGHEHTKIVDGVPEGWKPATLGDICSVRKETLPPSKINDSVPYIGLEHMPKKDICLSEWGDSSEINSSKFRYYEDDILFGKIRPYFHKVGFALNSGVASTDAIILRNAKGLWSLLLMTVSSSEFVNYTYQNCKEGAKMPRADWKQMKSYPIMIADCATQSAFEEQIYIITRKIKTLALQINRLSEARDRLLPKLMSGEVEV